MSYSWINKVFLSCIFLIIYLFMLNQKTGITSELTVHSDRELITPAHVFVEIQRVEQIIEQLRLFMGITKPDSLGIKISNAAPHDVYFQARTLAMKANRLSFELIRKHSPPPLLPGGVIRHVEVKDMVVQALQSIAEVRQALGLPAVDSPTYIDESTTPSDVFKATMRANRHLNTLLERRFSPDEVFRVVNLAIGYSSHLLAQYPKAERIPLRPSYESNKRPLDVYFRLYRCLLLIIKIYQANSYDILEIDISGIREQNITPSDVFDMASLIVARLDYLHKKIGIKKMARETYYPGRKFPSDVFQQAAILEQQLTTLLSHVTKAKNLKPVR